MGLNLSNSKHCNYAIYDSIYYSEHMKMSFGIDSKITTCWYVAKNSNTY